MLFDSLVHHLISKGLLTKNDALSVVQTVAEVKRAQAINADANGVAAKIVTRGPDMRFTPAGTSLDADRTVTLAIRYWTDPYVNQRGMFVDSIALGDFTSGAETDDGYVMLEADELESVAPGRSRRNSSGRCRRYRWASVGGKAPPPGAPASGSPPPQAATATAMHK